jgi:hypothetical protein
LQPWHAKLRLACICFIFSSVFCFQKGRSLV